VRSLATHSRDPAPQVMGRWLSGGTATKGAHTALEFVHDQRDKPQSPSQVIRYLQLGLIDLADFTSSFWTSYSSSTSRTFVD